MCDVKGHDHWCSVCGKNLNKVAKDSYTEIEWSQNEKGQIIEEKSMICNSCMEESENIKELNEYFAKLKYSPFGRIYCSCCKKDLIEELGKDIKPGVDYECLNFKCHEKSGSHIKHIIKVVILCKNCVNKEFNANNLEKLKKLGKNPKFSPMVVCDKIDECKQYQKGDKNTNCKNITIGRDRETLQFGLLCARRHKGALLLPFDDGFAITRPRKGKGAAVASPPTMAVAPGLNPLNDYMVTIEKMFKKYKIGKFAPKVDLDPIEAKLIKDGSDITILKNRIEELERKLGMHTDDIYKIEDKIQKIDENVSILDPIIQEIGKGCIVKVTKKTSGGYENENVEVA